MLFLSTRLRFQAGDPEWDSYIDWAGLPQLREVRSIDATLNRYVDRCGSLYCERSQIDDVIEMLPTPSSDREYYLLAVRVDSEAWSETFEGFEFLGCDLSDETMTSSILNCRHWVGQLAAFVPRLNRYGLLSVDDARQAQKLLVAEWGADEPHAHANLWAAFGRTV